ncbi:unnamed protein product [Oreochromis niloticus]|nr:unnamed protein product [Mustela putorius furo]
MAGVVVISPAGQKHLMPLPTEMLNMAVSFFIVEVLKTFVILGVLGCTEENVKLHVDGKPLDRPTASLADCGIKVGSTVQEEMKINVAVHRATSTR